MTNEEAAMVLKEFDSDVSEYFDSDTDQEECIIWTIDNELRAACRAGAEALRDTAYLNAASFEYAKELFHAWNMWEDENERATEMEERAKSAEQNFATEHDALKVAEQRIAELEAVYQKCAAGHQYLANSREYPCPWCEQGKNEQRIAELEAGLKAAQDVLYFKGVEAARIQQRITELEEWHRLDQEDIAEKNQRITELEMEV